MNNTVKEFAAWAGKEFVKSAALSAGTILALNAIEKTVDTVRVQVNRAKYRKAQKAEAEAKAN